MINIIIINKVIHTVINSRISDCNITNRPFFTRYYTLSLFY